MKSKKKIIGALYVFSICALVYSTFHLRYFPEENFIEYARLAQIFGITIIYIPIIYILSRLTKTPIFRDWKFPSVGMIFILFLVTILSIVVVQPFYDLPLNFQRALKGSATLNIFTFGVNRTVLGIIYATIVGPIYEEILFRGVVQTYLLRKFSVPVSIILSSIIFAICHFTISGFLPILLFGIVLGTIYYKTKSLWCPIITHFFANLAFSFLVNKTISGSHVYMYMFLCVIALIMLIIILKSLDKFRKTILTVDPQIEEKQ